MGPNKFRIFWELPKADPVAAHAMAIGEWKAMGATLTIPESVPRHNAQPEQRQSRRSDQPVPLDGYPVIVIFHRPFGNWLAK